LVPALALALALAGCTQDGADEADDPPFDASRPLVVVSGADLTSHDSESVRQDLIDEWNKANPGTPARLVELPRAEDGQRAELLASLQSGAANYDVLNIDVAQIPEFAETGLILPLDDDLVEHDFLEQAVAAGQWDGETYAVPFNTDVGLLYYNTQRAEEQGMSVADLTSADSMAELMGDWPGGGPGPAYVSQLRPYEGLTINTLEAFWSTGADGIRPVGEDGDYEGDQSELEDGLTQLVETADPDLLSQGSYEADETAALVEFTEEENGVAMMRGWPYMFNRLPAGKGYGVTALPGAAALGGQSLAVAAGIPDERQAAAERLISFLTSNADNQSRLFDAGFAPALRDAYELDDREGQGLDCADRTASPPPSDPEEERGLPASAPQAAADAERDFRELLWCALREAEPRPATEYYPAFSETLQQEVHRMLTEDVSASDTADCLNELLPLALEGKQPEDVDDVDECHNE
jgi:multiple sugar transport system substrate-binding protein